MDDTLIYNSDPSDDYFILTDTVSGISYVYSKTDGSITLQENDLLSEEGNTDSDPVTPDSTDLSTVLESIDTLTLEIEDLQADLLSSMDRSNELIGALLIVLLAHVTLMVFRKIFGMFS